MNIPTIKFKLSALFLLLLIVGGCVRETRFVVIDSSSSDSCSECRFHEYKVVTDGREFAIKNPWYVQDQGLNTCESAKQRLEHIVGNRRSVCGKCQDKKWKEVDCK